MPSENRAGLSAGDRPALLVSGLPLAGGGAEAGRAGPAGRRAAEAAWHSFQRQLDLLARFLREEGLPAFLAGPAPAPPPERPSRRPRKTPSGRAPAGGRSAPGPRWLALPPQAEGRPAEAGPAGPLPPGVPMEALLERIGAGALILLGYPDQFPFLPDLAGRAGLSIYLWAQFSRPPDPRRLRGVTCMPLTPATERFLLQAGVAGVGPSIPHGVDTRVFRPPPAPARRRARLEWGLEDCFVVGTVAANSARKRLDLVIEAFARLAMRHERSVLLLKTDRRVSHEGIDLLERVRRAGIEGRARVLLEPLSPAGLSELYGRMDVYLNLSEWEGFCIPVAEAMACGVPVACPPIQGPGEIVPYRDLRIERVERVLEGGTLLVQADPKAAAESLLQALEQPELRARLGRLGRQRALRLFDIRRVARRWARLIRGGTGSSYGS